MSKTKQELINMLQEDLKNERKHMMFYMQAGVMIKGLHREEIGEFLLEEAQGEHQHVLEFSRLIVQLGDTPGTNINEFSSNLECPYDILLYAKNMEQEVSNNYAKRLVETSTESGDSFESYVHLFYEDQLQDSQKTALELDQFLLPYKNKEQLDCS
jgi:ferritin